MSALWASTSSTLLLTISSEKMRGRVMGVRMQAITGEPFGNLWAGKVAESFGVLPALWIGAPLYFVLTLALALFAPKLRKQR